MTYRNVHIYSVWTGQISWARFRYMTDALKWAIDHGATTIRTGGRVIWRREDWLSDSVCARLKPEFDKGREP